ncbi:transposase domain-containing protein [Terrimonas ferruginea]
MHGIDPYTWLNEVLHLIAGHPVNKVAELLPHRYKNN